MYKTEEPMKSIEVKAFDSADEVRTFDKGKLELVDVNGRMVGRATFEPGWRWSESLKPMVKTKSCEAPHFQYHLSGTLHIKADDGAERDVKAGEVSMLGSGHDAWVIGDEPVVVIDFQGMVDYAKK
jgi:hypothetical protein